MTSVEIVVGYDANGRPHNIVLVDGHETEVTVYEIDPRAKLLQRGRAGNWILQQERRASQASPQAASLIRSWAYQTVHDGYITPDIEDTASPIPDAVNQAGATVRRFHGPDGTTGVNTNTGPVENNLTDRVVDEHGDVHGGLTF